MGAGKPERASGQDRAADVKPAINPCADWRVVSVEVVGEHRLHVRFVDGVEGHVQFMPTGFRGVFAHLVDPAKFAEVGIEYGAVTWPGELDLAPDAMHDEIAKSGEWILN